MKKLLLFFFLVIVFLGRSQSFTAPEIRDGITDNKERGEYLFLHYWDSFDFKNANVFIDGDVIYYYFSLMMSVPKDVSDQSIKNVLTNASKNDYVFSLFIDSFKVYLLNPKSYFCDYERYLSVCDFVINDERINQYAKYDFELEKEMILKNRIGDVATNFTVFDKKNNPISLDEIKSEYLLVFFNNPDCSVCMKNKNELANSVVINSMIDSGKMKVLSVCPYDEYDLWEVTDYPANWLNGFDKDQKINNEKLYYFLESSSIYLLDKNKKVLKKDIRVDMLEEYLETIQ